MAAEGPARRSRPQSRDSGGSRGRRGGAPDRSGQARAEERGGKGRGGGAKGGRRSPGAGSRGAAPGGPAGRERRFPRDPEDRTEAQRAYDGPPIPESVTGRELDRSVAAQLASLPEKLRLRVARHLVAAGLALESDPTTAYQHTLAARARAGRLALVREAVGEAAYAAGEYAEALAELRAARRMNGSRDYVAIMADCERALGRPDRALTLLRGVSREGMPADALTELVLVEAGARRDRGELDAALRVLEQAPLQSKSRAPWVARLRYAYADALAEAGRRSDALVWFHRTEAVDGAELTDAAARAAQLEQDD